MQMDITTDIFRCFLSKDIDAQESSHDGNMAQTVRI